MRYSGEEWAVSKTDAGLLLRAQTARHEAHKGRVLLAKPNAMGTRKVPTKLAPDGKILESEDRTEMLGEVWECSRDGKDTPLSIIDCGPKAFDLATAELGKKTA